MAKHEFGDSIRLVDGRDDLFREYVVMPSGQIKTCYYQRNVSSGLLHLEMAGSGRVSAIEDVRVAKQFAAQGFVLLRDLYEQEGRMQDYEAFLIYQSQARKRNISIPIDDAYLPDEVLRRRATWVEEQKKLDLPPPQPKKPKKAQARGAANGKGYNVADVINGNPGFAFLPRKEAIRLARAAIDRERL